jgi:pimeloyl-ACP methyl ester carboxylesterase
MPGSAAPVVLVHGAWHGPWCWDRVTPLLRERGIDAIAIDLPSMDVNAGHVTVHDDAKTLRKALDALDRPAVVVGHSYGGGVITEGAADHPMVKRLVYLAAFLPEVGESLNDLFSLVPNPHILGFIKPTDDGRTAPDPAMAGAVFYNDCDEATVAWATQQLRSMNMDGASPATAAAWHALPSTYVVCTQDRIILPELQRRMAERTNETVELDTSHSPFASRPELVADLLERLARA